MRACRLSLAILTFASCSNLLNAGPGQIQKVVQNEKSGASSALDGYVSNDILISFTGQYTGSQLLIENLGDGAIYQDIAGDRFAPNATFLAPPFSLTDLKFDTFVAQGTTTRGSAFGDPQLGGGAINLGGTKLGEFSDSTIDQAWNPAGGQVITDQSDFLIARLTLRDSINSSALLLIATDDVGGGLIYNASITNGVVSNFTAVPEPSAAALLALVFLASGIRSTIRRFRKMG